ncbi:MAG: hypothetical protein QOC62_5019 [Mycobacterium sp.]|jgi:uncharacterized membrane protein YqhA|nr:hypothetical protein [Mycobacterium sp.]
MADVRTQGERADDMVAGFVDRMLGRDRVILAALYLGVVLTRLMFHSTAFAFVVAVL